MVDFLGGPVVKNLPSNAEDSDSISGWELRDLTCHEAAKPAGHYDWAHALESVGHKRSPQAEIKDLECHS